MKHVALTAFKLIAPIETNTYPELCDSGIEENLSLVRIEAWTKKAETNLNLKKSSIFFNTQKAQLTIYHYGYFWNELSSDESFGMGKFYLGVSWWEFLEEEVNWKIKLLWDHILCEKPVPGQLFLMFRYTYDTSKKCKYIHIYWTQLINWELLFYWSLRLKSGFFSKKNISLFLKVVFSSSGHTRDYSIYRLILCLRRSPKQGQK